MEGIGSCNNFGFDSCQIQENTSCARIGSWGSVGDITGIYSVCIEVGCIFVSNLSQMKTIRFSYTELGGCPFHGRVERDEIPTRESPPKQSGTLPCEVGQLN